jgi:uncharacterized protein with FMN-binding domain
MRTKAPHHLLALSSAAVMAVYGAGFLRTRAAAARFSDEPAMRRPVAAAAPSVEPEAASQRQVEQMRAPAPPAHAVASAAIRAVSPGNVAVPLPTAPKPSSTPKGEPAVVGEARTAPAPVPQPAAAPVENASIAATIAPTDTAALAPLAAAAAAPVKAKYKDGAFLGYGTSRHGDIQAQVTIANDRIIAVSISKCLTQYSCDWLAPLPGQVVARQSAETDYVSGATQSTNAFYYAVVEALALAQNR